MEQDQGVIPATACRKLGK